MNLSDVTQKSKEKEAGQFRQADQAGSFFNYEGDSQNDHSSPQVEFGFRRERPSSARKTTSLFLFAGAAILIIGLLGSSGYFYYQYRSLSGGSGADEIKTYLEQLEKFVVLPEGEEPTLATVTDKDKLGDQPFFTNAQNGDKVIVFPKAGKAILFRPKEGKIVEMMALSGSSAEPLPENKKNNE